MVSAPLAMNKAMSRHRPGAVLLVLGVVCAFVAWPWTHQSFVGGPSATRTTRLPATHLQKLARKVSTTVPESGPAGKTPEKAVPEKEGKETKSQEEIDDAVLRMAMAMAEEEEGPTLKSVQTEKEEEGFDFNNVVTLFWIVIIVYSFGSSFIGITTGRIQDRTGGDFTAYDFFDNIFSFKEWDLEYSLGFDPFKLFASIKEKLGVK